MPTTPATLRDLFRATLDGLREMHGLLEQESVALGGRDAAALERIALTKQELVPILDRLAAEQRRFFAAGPGGTGGIEAYLAGAKPEADLAGALRADWREILRLLAACKHQNEMNGAYIGLLRRHVENALDILHGPAQAEATYGRDGVKRRGGVHSRRFYAV